MRKHKLTEESIQHSGRTLYRIEALKHFGNVKKGEKGGWVERESNLSHDGDCWIYHTAKVFGDAKVSGNAKVYEEAIVYGDAEVCGNAKVWGYAKTPLKVYGQAVLKEYRWYEDQAELDKMASPLYKVLMKEVV